MATVLVCMLQEHGHLNPSFKISRTLRARGHDVKYFGIPDLAAHIEAQGFDCVPFLPELHPRGTLEADDRLGLLERRRGVTRRFGVACEHLLPGGSLRAAIERLAPRAMIVDVNHTLFGYAAWQLGIPSVAMNVTLPQTRDPGVPPLRTGARLRPGWRGRLHADLRWRAFLARRELVALAAGAAGMCPPYELARRAARRFGYPAARLDTRTVYMPRLAGVPELVLCPEGFDFPRPPRPERHFAESVDLERREDEFPWQRLDAAKPLVYVSMGSQHGRRRGARRLLATAVRALGARPDWQGVVALGRQFAPEELGACAPNVVVVRSAPQLALLARARAMVTHGGLGSVKECILHGVPMAVFPLAVDQHDNAVRVEYHGIGARGDPRRVSPRALLEVLDDLLAEGGARSRIAALRERFAATERATRGADLVEAMAGERR